MRYQFLRFPGGKPKALTFSYDDGCIEDIRFAQILTSYGLKGTFNLNCDVLRKGSGLSQADVEEYLLSKGHEIAVHGQLHRAEGGMRPIEGIRDVLECRLELEKKYGRIIRGMAFPDFGITKMYNGANYEAIKQYLKELDIVYSRTLGGDNNRFTLPEDWLAWMPTAHHNNPALMGWLEELLNFDYNAKGIYCANRGPRLCYIWGHSYEFERNQNWELAEQICEKVAGKEDVWYATNMEIYEYVTAYQSLVYSADGSRIYNPTLKTIWMERDEKLYSIQFGEEVKMED
ncbi:MAG: polysaccharide deacetylase [Firmicutes bacterium]|nr:polysaccharide deacetylase [Bacillota bacterium]